MLFLNCCTEIECHQLTQNIKSKIRDSLGDGIEVRAETSQCESIKTSPVALRAKEDELSYIMKTEVKRLNPYWVQEQTRNLGLS